MAVNTPLLPIDGTIREVEFSSVMRTNFGEYAYATVADRALADYRDGLKPSQRRVLYAMFAAGFTSNKPTRKSAMIVGEVTGKYHPHGDVAIYETMVRMAQDFTMRYPLIHGQGNMGSVEPDPPAASRYTEARLSLLAEVLLADVDKETVPLNPTYLQDPKVAVEPLYLTGHVPPCVNPISGIAVGLTTDVPPHNLGEVIDAATALLDRPTMDTKGLMKYVKGPDFPSGGRVLGEEGIVEYLETGKGKMVLRGTVRLEDSPKGGRALVITELPFTTKERIKETVAKAVNEHKVEGIAGLSDESDEDHGLRIVLALRRDADAAAVLGALYQHTDLQRNVSVQMVYLMGEPGKVAAEPRRVGMVELLTSWNVHQVDVLTKRLEHELRRAEERLHIVRGLIVGATNAQQIVRIFQQAPDRATAKEEIKRKYKLSDIQAETIAQMTLSQVTRLDAGKYEEERAALEKRIAEIKELLGDRAMLVAQLKSEYKVVKDKFGDSRRTVIDGAAEAEVTVVQNIIDEKTLRVEVSPDGYVRVAGPGKRRARKDYPTLATFDATTLDHAVFVSDVGKVYALRANDLPETSGRGESLRKLLQLAAEEVIVAAFATSEFAADRYLVQFTRLGRVKKSALAEYRSADAAGIGDLALQAGDRVRTAFVAAGGGHYVVLTSDAKALRFADEQVRASGRIGQGVQAISLAGSAEVVGAFAIVEDDRRFLATVTTLGSVKRTPLADYPLKGRATGGQAAMGIGRGESFLGGAVLGLKVKDELVLILPKDATLRLPAKSVPLAARDGKGKRPADLPKGEAPIGVTTAEG